MRILLSLILLLPGFGAERLNVILFVTDDQSPVAGCYGNSVIKTPHLDALAKEGTMFTQAFATTAKASHPPQVFLRQREQGRALPPQAQLHNSFALSHQ